MFKVRRSQWNKISTDCVVGLICSRSEEVNGINYLLIVL